MWGVGWDGLGRWGCSCGDGEEDETGVWGFLSEERSRELSPSSLRIFSFSRLLLLFRRSSLVSPSVRRACPGCAPSVPPSLSSPPPLLEAWVLCGFLSLSVACGYPLLVPSRGTCEWRPLPLHPLSQHASIVPSLSAWFSSSSPILSLCLLLASRPAYALRFDFSLFFRAGDWLDSLSCCFHTAVRQL